jgi:hypothetical protein
MARGVDESRDASAYPSQAIPKRQHGEEAGVGYRVAALTLCHRCVCLTNVQCLTVFFSLLLKSTCARRDGQVRKVQYNAFTTSIRRVQAQHYSIDRHAEIHAYSRHLFFSHAAPITADIPTIERCAL